ncbi:MAG: heliorhodopsin HeR [Promethearchaeota archaeon]
MSYTVSTNTEQTISPISFPYLRKFNLSMGILHLIQGLLMLTLGFLLEFERDIYTFYLKFEGEAESGFTITPNPEILFTFSFVGPLVALFLLLSALAHLLIAFPLNRYYEENLQRKMNPIRWFEYALSSSVMIVFIAILFGVWDFWALVMIFVLNALMNMFGFLMEKINEGKDKVDWTPYILGVIAGILPWIVITAFFVNITVVGGEVPWFVYWIYFVEFFFYNTFAINMLLQYKKVGPWKDYLYGERGYQILSLVSKTALAWLVFAGLFQPN